MAELALILTDFFAATVGAPAVIERLGTGRRASASATAAPEAAEATPRLPALETVLARASSVPLAGDWRAWLAPRLALPQRSGLAATAAAAFSERVRPPQPPQARVHYWFATPLHLFAGIDSVHLHPAGLLQLEDAEQQQLAEDFARVFADAPWRLSAIGQRELLLAGPALYASAADPAALILGAPDASMASGPDAPALRRLGSEMELWLHQHPLNLERSRRGQLAVTGLWLWGGMLQPQQPPAPAAAAIAPALPRLFGHDSYAAALWRLRGASAAPLPASMMAEPALLEARASVVLLPLLSELGLIASLLDLERLWLAPALAAVRARRLSALHCVLGVRAYRLTWRHCIRVWRRRAPWWEELS